MSERKPGMTTRPNRDAIDQRGDAYIEQICERSRLLRQIADRCDEAGVVVSDLTLVDGLTSGKIRLTVHDLAALLGLAGHRQDDGRETT